MLCLNQISRMYPSIIKRLESDPTTGRTLHTQCLRGALVGPCVNYVSLSTGAFLTWSWCWRCVPGPTQRTSGPLRFFLQVPGCLPSRLAAHVPTPCLSGDLAFEDPGLWTVGSRDDLCCAKVPDSAQNAGICPTRKKYSPKKEMLTDGSFRIASHSAFHLQLVFWEGCSLGFAHHEV